MQGTAREGTVAVRSASDVESRTQAIGRELLAAMRGRQAGLMSGRFWSDKLMDWALRDPAFKVQMFRFVDVFPMLHTPAQVHDYLADYLTQPGVSLPPGMELGLKAGRLAKGLMARSISASISAMAGTFIAGRDAATAVDVLRKLWKEGAGFTVDLLGEACVSDEEARAYQRRYLDLLEFLPGEVARWPADAQLDRDHLGPLPRAGVSIKLSALAPRTDPIDFEGSLNGLVESLRPILEAAARQQVTITFDMEQASMKDLTLAVVERCCETLDFPAGLALQAYLRSGLADAQRIVAWTRRTGRQLTVRLIKGAYWDYEVVHAEQMGWPVPVWTAKRETDACFERMAEVLLAATPRTAGDSGVKLALGSHNVRSISHVLALAEQLDLPPTAVEFQKLYGMADALRGALRQRGLRVREYLPLGEVIPGMAYLVRRLLENTSNQSWLRAGASDGVTDEVLLASPHGGPESPPADPAAAAKRHALSPALAALGDGLPMQNEPLRDFSQAEQRAHFARAVAAVRGLSQFSFDEKGTVPLTGIHSVGVADAEKALAQAAAAFPAWRDRPALERAEILLRAGGLLRQRRDELAAVMVREAGKPWREADADVCEAIDFCEYYARAAAALLEPRQLGRFLAESNQQGYQARGVACVISPWNFPLAICTGMTTAALVVGNTVIVKPSTQTRAIAQLLCECLHRAGVPRAALHFLPGEGRTIGDLLVHDPRVATIAFTGSKEVGLHILRLAAETAAEQTFVKKVVCEMGGKNAIIVDDSADLDEAVLGVRQSAFGYCGQKCSACSRTIVLADVHDRFLARLVAATRSLVIGDPAEPSTDFGPLIDAAAAAKVAEYIAIGRVEGRLELAVEPPPGLAERVGKPYIGPHIFSGIKPQHRLANEEVFGPVLAVMRAETFEEALAIANGTAYKLTGGVFSRKPAHLQAARQEFRVGNLYLNRGITGALVGRQPFGGFGLSGGGTKAGGSDYLLNFVDPRAWTENTLRHGFAPGVE